MQNKIMRTLMTVKYFVLSMFLVSVVMSVLVGWLVFRLIMGLPENTGGREELGEVRALSGEVERVYGECLGRIDWGKLSLDGAKGSFDECLRIASESEAYRKLRQIYEIEVLPLVR